MSPRKMSKVSAQAIGSVIRTWRHRRNLAQKELAAKAGVTPGTIGSFERGERAPSVELRAKICAGLELDPLIFCREVATIEGMEMRKLAGDNTDPEVLPVERFSAAWDVVFDYVKDIFLKAYESGSPAQEATKRSKQ